MTDQVLSQLGDVANIVIAVASVATAIVTAIVLCKQHKLQKQQHALEKEKLNAQQLEHIRPGEYLQTVTFDTLPQSGDNITMKVMAYEPDTYLSAGAVSLKTVIS